uniref:AlNc14C457G11768 protein n=1 Tax=Albugo laibachii Nc14 TaxID=890382 RepID=F0X029_9STRA|nr:AlNc14C457G11768 [Albugo laibachii Nc14]|eukprot:CCA27111.1 AlNc14C457G11768 [Albugo laibachii Nc14]
MTELDNTKYESDSDVQCDTLVEFHRRLVHLCYDTIIKIARDLLLGNKPKTYNQTKTPAKALQLMSLEE